MKMKKVLAGLLVSAMSMGVLAGCGSSTNNTSNTSNTNNTSNTASKEDSTAQEEKTAPGERDATIRLSWWGGDSRHEATQKAVDAFMEKYPKIKVEVEFGAWSGWEENIATQLMSKTAPDVLQINWNWINSYSSTAQTFLDLNSVSDILDLSQWEESILNQCKVGNNLQAVPVAMTGRTFYWNESTFEKAGIETPKSLADLMAAGPVFQEKLGDKAYPLVMGEYDRMIFLVYFLESKYGKNWVEDNKVNYTADQIKEGLDLLAEMEEKHVIPTLQKLAGDGADSIDKNQNWIEGNYAGILEWDTSASKFIKATPDSKIVVGDYFKDLGEYQGGFTKVSMGFAIDANTKYPEECALLMQYLLNDAEGAAIMASERGIPASKAAYTVCETGNLIDPNVAEANGKVMSWCQYSLDPKFEDNALKSNPDGVYYKIMSKVSYGQMDTATGAAELLKQVDEFLAK
ncbi:ABC transporter substrate-binding protein [Niameybacter massiliensis]|uniref:ABC transporter substrate-binding protein n=1 Tax=Holtiella tumoricola TaxID=3018743 RepID=A0AA42J1N9_9FIRM|nr:ABC transporter substrate-binding protein [Holtiella tumoricola]MDA3732724.1 ABC transporter substrate-binding protein [Holtiella tumoricola]